MSFFHGVRVTTKTTENTSVNSAECGIAVAVGTAPVNQVQEPKNIVLANSYSEAVAAMGYSDDWKKYTLCEVMYTHFKLYGVAPVIFINVANVKENSTAVEAQSFAVVNGQVELPESAIADSVKVTADGAELAVGTDYEVFFSDGACVIEAISGGGMDGAETVEVAYNDFTLDMESMKEKVIGGYDTESGESTGLELIDNCYAMYQVDPDLIIAPGFSHDPEVAAVMDAKTKVNSLFRARAIIDCDCDTVRVHNKVVEWRKENGLTNDTEILCWPMVQKAGKIFHYSSHLAALMATVDAENENCPSESPSNKELQIDGLALADGTEVVLNLEKANYLNANGIVTAINFVGGFKAWGNYTAAYPDNKDPRCCWINVARMFDWVSNSLILTYWNRVDRKLNRRLCETIADSATIWINGLTSAGHLYGGRVEFNDAENPDEDIMAGILRPHVYMAPPAPAQEIDWIVEYDASYVSEALS